MDDADATDWPREMFDLLVDGGVSLFAYVPDAGNKSIIELAEAHNKTRAVLLSTEEEGVAICAGADLVGRRAVLCMQSSGVGNCPNFLSLITGGRFPLLMVVSMRGDYGEQNPWQYPMGQAVEPVLAAMGIVTIRLERPQDLADATTAALSAAFKAEQGVALILSQQFLGAKAF
jgi:sulfopyruvate decarboxylase alpha subunit